MLSWHRGRGLPLLYTSPTPPPKPPSMKPFGAKIPGSAGSPSLLPTDTTGSITHAGQLEAINCFQSTGDDGLARSHGTI